MIHFPSLIKNISSIEKKGGKKENNNNDNNIRVKNKSKRVIESESEKYLVHILDTIQN